jgi:hypothetical protein
LKSLVILYFLIGAIIISLEWLVITLSESEVYPKYDNKIVTMLSAIFIFLIEVVIWPRQITVFFIEAIKISGLQIK